MPSSVRPSNPSLCLSRIETQAVRLTERLLREHGQRSSSVETTLVKLALGSGDNAAVASALFALVLGLLPRLKDAEGQLRVVAAARRIAEARSSGLEDAVHAGATRCLVRSMLSGALAALAARALGRGEDRHAARLCDGLAALAGALIAQSCDRRDLDSIFCALRNPRGPAETVSAPFAIRARSAAAVALLRELCGAVGRTDDRNPRAYVACRPSTSLGVARCPVRVDVGRRSPAASRAPLKLVEDGVTWAAWIRIEDPRQGQRRAPVARVELSPGGRVHERRTRRGSGDADESELCVLARIDTRTRATIYLRHSRAGTDLMVGISPPSRPPAALPSPGSGGMTTPVKGGKSPTAPLRAGFFGFIGALIGDDADGTETAPHPNQLLQPSMKRGGLGSPTPTVTPLKGARLATNARSLVEKGEDVISVAGNLPQKRWIWVAVSVGADRETDTATAAAGGASAKDGGSWFGGGGGAAQRTSSTTQRRGSTRIVTSIAESVASRDIASGTCKHPSEFDGHVTGGSLKIRMGGFDGQLANVCLSAPALSKVGINELWNLARRAAPPTAAAPRRAPSSTTTSSAGLEASSAAAAAASAGGSGGGWWPWDGATSDSGGDNNEAAETEHIEGAVATAGREHNARVPRTRSVVLFLLDEKTVIAAAAAATRPAASSPPRSTEKETSARSAFHCEPIGVAWRSAARLSGASALHSTSTVRDALYASGGPAVALPLLLCVGSALRAGGEMPPSPWWREEERRAQTLAPLLPRCVLLSSDLRRHPAHCASLPLLGLQLLAALISDGRVARRSSSAAAAAPTCDGATSRRHAALARKQRLLVCAAELLERLAPSQLSAALWDAALALGRCYVATTQAFALHALRVAGVNPEVELSRVMEAHPCVVWVYSIIDAAAHDAYAFLVLSSKVWGRALQKSRSAVLQKMLALLEDEASVEEVFTQTPRDTFVVARSVARRATARHALRRVHPILLVHSIAHWPSGVEQEEWSAAMNVAMGAHLDGGSDDGREGGGPAEGAADASLAVVHACIYFVQTNGCNARLSAGGEVALPCVLRLLLLHCSLVQAAGGIKPLRAAMRGDGSSEGDTSTRAQLSDAAFSAWDSSRSGSPPWWWGALCSPQSEARALVVHLLRSGLIALQRDGGSSGAAIAMGLFARPFARPGCGVDSAVLRELAAWLKSAAQELRYAVTKASALRLSQAGKKDGKGTSSVYSARQLSGSGGTAADASKDSRLKKRRKQQALRRRKLQLAHRGVIRRANDLGEAARVLLKLVTSPAGNIELTLQTEAVIEVTRIFESIGAHCNVVAQQEETAMRKSSMGGRTANLLDDDGGVCWADAGSGTRVSLSVMAYMVLPAEVTTKIRIDAAAAIARHEEAAAAKEARLDVSSPHGSKSPHTPRSISHSAASPRSSGFSPSSDHSPRGGKSPRGVKSPPEGGKGRKSPGKSPRPKSPGPKSPRPKSPGSSSSSSSRNAARSPMTPRSARSPRPSSPQSSEALAMMGGDAALSVIEEAAEGAIELVLGILKDATDMGFDESSSRSRAPTPIVGGGVASLSDLSRLRIAVVGMFASLLIHGCTIVSSCVESALHVAEPDDASTFLLPVQPQVLVCLLRSYRTQLSHLTTMATTTASEPSLDSPSETSALAAQLSGYVATTAHFLLERSAHLTDTDRAHARLIVGLRKELCLALRTLYPTGLLLSTALARGEGGVGGGAARTASGSPPSAPVRAAAKPQYPGGLGWQCIAALLCGFDDSTGRSDDDEGNAPFFHGLLIGAGVIGARSHGKSGTRGEKKGAAAKLAATSTQSLTDESNSKQKSGSGSGGLLSMIFGSSALAKEQKTHTRELELLQREQALEQKRNDALARVHAAQLKMHVALDEMRKVWLIGSLLRIVSNAQECVLQAPQSVALFRGVASGQVTRDRLASLLRSLVLENKDLLDRHAQIVNQSVAVVEEEMDIERRFSHASPIAARASRSVRPIPSKRLSNELLLILTRAPPAESNPDDWNRKIAALLESRVFAEADQGVEQLDASHGTAIDQWRARVRRMRGRAPDGFVPQLQTLTLHSMARKSSAKKKGLNLKLDISVVEGESAAYVSASTPDSPLRHECRSVGAGVVRLLQRLAQENRGASLWGQFDANSCDVEGVLPGDDESSAAVPRAWAISPRESGGSFGYARQRRLLVRSWSTQMPRAALSQQAAAGVLRAREVKAKGKKGGAAATWAEEGVVLLNGGCEFTGLLSFGENANEIAPATWEGSDTGEQWQPRGALAAAVLRLSVTKRPPSAVFRYAPSTTQRLAAKLSTREEMVSCATPMRRAPQWQWAADDIVTIHARRYRLRRTAFEIALRPGARCTLGDDSVGGGGYGTATCGGAGGYGGSFVSLLNFSEPPLAAAAAAASAAAAAAAATAMKSASGGPPATPTSIPKSMPKASSPKRESAASVVQRWTVELERRMRGARQRGLGASTLAWARHGKKKAKSASSSKKRGSTPVVAASGGIGSGPPLRQDIPHTPIGLRLGSVSAEVHDVTELWRKRLISNFDYLMTLNTAAGRSFNDLNQYPVFPIILDDYSRTALEAKGLLPERNAFDGSGEEEEEEADVKIKQELAAMLAAGEEVELTPYRELNKCIGAMDANRLKRLHARRDVLLHDWERQCASLLASSDGTMAPLTPHRRNVRRSIQIGESPRTFGELQQFGVKMGKAVGQRVGKELHRIRETATNAQKAIVKRAALSPAKGSSSMMSSEQQFQFQRVPLKSTFNHTEAALLAAPKANDFNFKFERVAFAQPFSGAVPPFLYGSHYSSAGVVLHYMLRIEPFHSQHRELQGGRLDHADRLFLSVTKAWGSNEGQSDADLKESIPAMYYAGYAFRNVSDIALGSTQEGIVAGDVLFPKWARAQPSRFTALHRAALESEHVSNRLHHWVDLVFGCKQRGAAALRANNEFHHLTYEGAVDVEAIDDVRQRRAVEAQIDSFGQTPAQLFNAPHPRRGAPSDLATRRASAMRECALKLHAELDGDEPRYDRDDTHIVLNDSAGASCVGGPGTGERMINRFFPDLSAPQRRAKGAAGVSKKQRDFDPLDATSSSSSKVLSRRSSASSRTTSPLFIATVEKHASRAGNVGGVVAQINAEGVLRVLPRWHAELTIGLNAGAKRSPVSRTHHYAELPRSVIFALRRAQSLRGDRERESGASSAMMRPVALFAQLASGDSVGGSPSTTLIAAVESEIHIVALSIDETHDLAPRMFMVQSFAAPATVCAIAVGAVRSACDESAASTSSSTASSARTQKRKSASATATARRRTATSSRLHDAARRAFALARAPIAGWLVAACVDGGITLWPMLHREAETPGRKLFPSTHPHVVESTPGCPLSIGSGALCARPLCGHVFNRDVRAVRFSLCVFAYCTFFLYTYPHHHHPLLRSLPLCRLRSTSRWALSSARATAAMQPWRSLTMHQMMLLSSACTRFRSVPSSARCTSPWRSMHQRRRGTQNGSSSSLCGASRRFF